MVTSTSPRAPICRSGDSRLARRKTSPRRSSRQVWPIPTHRWKRSAMSWRARLVPTIALPPSILMLLRATSKPCSRANPRFGRCRPNSASSSTAAAYCRWQTSPPTLWFAPMRGSLLSSLDGGMLAALCDRPSLTETVKALALAFLRLSAQRSEKPRRMRALVMSVGEEAIFAEAGLTAVQHLRRTRARRKIVYRIDIIRRIRHEMSSVLVCLSAASKPIHYARLPTSRSVTAMEACAPRPGARCC